LNTELCSVPSFLKVCKWHLYSVALFRIQLNRVSLSPIKSIELFSKFVSLPMPIKNPSPTYHYLHIKMIWNIRFFSVCPCDLCWQRVQEYFWFFGANLSRAWALVMTGFSNPIHSNPSRVRPIQSEPSWAEPTQFSVRNLYILLINLLILGQLLFWLFADLVIPDRATHPLSPKPICPACKSLSSRLKIRQNETHKSQLKKKMSQLWTHRKCPTKMMRLPILSTIRSILLI